MRRYAPPLIALFSVVLLWAPPARADPITIVITSGTAEFNPVNSEGTGTPFRFFGPGGFSLTLFAGDGHAGPPGDPLSPGQTTHFSGVWSGNDLTGTATYAGEDYTHIGGLVSANQAFVDFTGSDFIVPAAGSGTTTVLAPFTLNGTFEGTPGSGESETPTLFARLIGSGIGQLPLTYDPTAGGWLPGIVHLNISTPAPAPVPEPTTLLLLGLGVAGAYGSTRRRRQASR
jgi:hypothetical protein